MEFKQFDLPYTRFHYSIDEKGIRLIKKRISASSDTFVHFEDIGAKIIVEKSQKLLWLFLSVLFLVIGVSVFVSRMKGGKVGDGAEIFHVCTSLFFLAVYYATRKNTVHLTQPDNSNAIEFIGTKRYRKQVDDFIQLLLNRRNHYLMQKYATLDEYLPYNQQYNNLVWLYDLNLLTKETLGEKIRELDEIKFREEEE